MDSLLLSKSMAGLMESIFIIPIEKSTDVLAY
jgi:hypothetical protein